MKINPIIDIDIIKDKRNGKYSVISSRIEKEVYLQNKNIFEKIKMVAIREKDFKKLVASVQDTAKAVK